MDPMFHLFGQPGEVELVNLQSILKQLVLSDPCCDEEKAEMERRESIGSPRSSPPTPSTCGESHRNTLNGAIGSMEPDVNPPQSPSGCTMPDGGLPAPIPQLSRPAMRRKRKHDKRQYNANKSRAVAMKEDNSSYKTTVCVEWKAKGMCAAGDACWYAHGEKELRSQIENQSAVASVARLMGKFAKAQRRDLGAAGAAAKHPPKTNPVKSADQAMWTSTTGPRPIILTHPPYASSIAPSVNPHLMFQPIQYPERWTILPMAASSSAPYYNVSVQAGAMPSPTTGLPAPHMPISMAAAPMLAHSKMSTSSISPLAGPMVFHRAPAPHLHPISLVPPATAVPVSMAPVMATPVAPMASMFPVLDLDAVANGPQSFWNLDARNVHSKHIKD